MREEFLCFRILRFIHDLMWRAVLSNDAMAQQHNAIGCAITDDWLDLYDHQVRVEFTGFLRPQIKFDSAQDLIDELKRNVEETKRITA